MKSTPWKDGIETKTADGVVDCHFLDKMFELIMKEVKKRSPDGFSFYAISILEELAVMFGDAIEAELNAFEEECKKIDSARETHR